MGGKRFRNKACAYCGNASSTGDHVVARSLFPVELRVDLPKVPACTNCNSQKSKLETYLAATLPMAGNHPAAQGIIGEAVQRVLKNRKLQIELDAGFDRMAHLATSTGHPTEFRSESLLSYASYLGRGLLHLHFGLILDPEYEARGMGLDLAGQDGFDRMFATVANQAHQVDGIFAAGAFVYRGFVSKEDPQVSTWQMRLYGGLNLGVESAGFGASKYDIAAMTMRREMFGIDHGNDEIPM